MKDIFMISETKIDNSFPISEFTMTGKIFLVQQLKPTSMLISNTVLWINLRKKVKNLNKSNNAIHLISIFKKLDNVNAT